MFWCRVLVVCLFRLCDLRVRTVSQLAAEKDSRESAFASGAWTLGCRRHSVAGVRAVADVVNFGATVVARCFESVQKVARLAVRPYLHGCRDRRNRNRLHW